MAKNTLIIGWDGAQRKDLLKLLKDGDLPNLNQLKTQGSLAKAKVEGQSTNEGLKQLDAAQKMNSPFLGFIHLWDPDHTGHKKGEDSKAYHNTFKDADKQLGQITDRLKTNGQLKDTDIFVVTDHGFDGEKSDTDNKKGHKNAPNIWMVSNRGLKGGKSREDFGATIAKSAGLTTSSLSGTPLQKR